jgi:hypothetical protein
VTNAAKASLFHAAAPPAGLDRDEDDPLPDSGVPVLAWSTEVLGTVRPGSGRRDLDRSTQPGRIGRITTRADGCYSIRTDDRGRQRPTPGWETPMNRVGRPSGPHRQLTRDSAKMSG